MELADLQTKGSSLQSRVSALEDRAKSLSASLHQYKLVRDRFISTFKRDILNTVTGADREIIRSGNMWTHDAIVDAQLSRPRWAARCRRL